MANEHITLVKLGGAIVTNKDIPESLRRDVLDRLIAEIARAKKEKDFLLVLGNGAGSYAHVPASRYKTKQGFIADESVMGMAITQDSAARLNREVVRLCLEHDLPAVTLAPSNSLVTSSSKADAWFTDVFEEYLKKGLLPATYGDVIVDRKQGCTIWSTDTVFAFFARAFTERGWTVDEIIHVTEANGVWKMKEGAFSEAQGQRVIFEKITPNMKEEVKTSMIDTKGFDVTGGMWHKIEEALSLTELGIQTRILSGLTPNAVYDTLTKKADHGTIITTV